MTTLVLLRHGESNTTVARRIGGFRTCTGLSALGTEQCKRLRERFKNGADPAPDVLLTSHFRRARQTAEIIAEAFPGVEPVEEQGFGEHDPGPTCDGMSYDDFVRRYGTETWNGDPFVVGFPGGETLAEFHFRVGTTLRRTLDAYPAGRVMVSCHGGVIDAVLRIALKSPSSGLFELHTLNTSITELVLAADHLWRLMRYNDAAHLHGLPPRTEQ